MNRLEKLLNTLDSVLISGDKNNATLLNLSSEVGDIRIDELSRMPLHINVIMISAIGKLKETAHSSILQHLLKHQSILDSFIANVFGIDGVKVKSKNVRPAEQDRIDISVYDTDICIIIENKVNNAPEQPGQIYRYVKLAMETGYKAEQVRVLYLNSNNHCKPSDFSLTENGERIPQEVEETIVIKDYAHDIYDWLKELPSIIPEDQEYLLSALHQYQDYLEEKFHLTDKYKNMKERIRITITENLLKGLSDENDADYSKRINALDEASENLQQLLDSVNELANSYSVTKDAILIKQEISKYDLSLIDLAQYGYEQNEFGVKIAINGKPGYIAYGYGDREYIGFAFETSSLTKAEINYLNRLFKKLGKENYGEEELWPCWNYIGETTLLNEFSNFAHYVKKQSEIEDKVKIEFI